MQIIDKNNHPPWLLKIANKVKLTKSNWITINVNGNEKQH